MPQEVKDSDGVGRLFIDPASISSGWAYFKGRELVAHGTVNTTKSLSIFHRLLNIYISYRALQVPGTVEEVHAEQLPRRCHIYTHWSVAVIGLALTKFTLNIAGDVPVKSWQKACNWQKDSNVWQTLGYKSEDEFAAVCMGNWYVGRVA